MYSASTSAFCFGDDKGVLPWIREKLDKDKVAIPTVLPNTDEVPFEAIAAAKPDLILDNGGDLFLHYLQQPYATLRGGTEETTSGRMRLEPLREKLNMPILVINDSPIKQFAENDHAVGQSTLESYMRITNKTANGERVTVRILKESRRYRLWIKNALEKTVGNSKKLELTIMILNTYWIERNFEQFEKSLEYLNWAGKFISGGVTRITAADDRYLIYARGES